MFLMPIYVLLPNICGLRWVVMDWVNCVVNPHVRNESLHKVPGLSKSLAERLIWIVVSEEGALTCAQNEELAPNGHLVVSWFWAACELLVSEIWAQMIVHKVPCIQRVNLMLLACVVLACGSDAKGWAGGLLYHRWGSESWFVQITKIGVGTALGTSAPEISASKAGTQLDYWKLGGQPKACSTVGGSTSHGRMGGRATRTAGQCVIPCSIVLTYISDLSIFYPGPTICWATRMVEGAELFCHVLQSNTAYWGHIRQERIESPSLHWSMTAARGYTSVA